MAGFIKRIMLVAVPVALQNLLLTTQSIIDTMMLAPMGENVIASVGLCASFGSLLFSCYWGFACGGTLFFSQYWGAKDESAIKKNFGVTLVFMMIVGIIFASTAMINPNLVMKLYTDKQNLYGVGESYLRIIAPAYLLQIYGICMCTLLRATERVKIPFYASVITTIANVLLNYMFIFGKFDMTKMGATGAALGTLIASVINVSVIWWLAKRANYHMILEIKDHLRWDTDTVKEYFAKCFPIICNELFMGVANMVISAVLGRQSEQVIAALVVFRVVESCIVAFFTGFSNAASILVGKSVGAGEIELAKTRAKCLVPLCAITIASVEGIIYVLHTPIFHCMGLSGETFDICTSMMVIYSVAAVIRMSNWIQNETYRSAGDAKFGTILEIAFMYVLVLPMVCLTGLYLKGNIVLVFMMCYIDEPIRFILMQVHMYSYKWIKPVTEAGKLSLTVQG